MAETTTTERKSKRAAVKKFAKASARVASKPFRETKRIAKKAGKGVKYAAKETGREAKRITKDGARTVKKAAKSVKKAFGPRIEIPVNADNYTDNFNALESFSSDIQDQLKSLGPQKSHIVAKHLASAIEILETEPQEAYKNAIMALENGSRLAFVREVIGLAAYSCGEWKKAIGEFRAAHRINGSNTYIPNIADCFRALKEYDKVIEICHLNDANSLDADVHAELKIVEAGTYADLNDFLTAHTIINQEYNKKQIPLKSSIRLAEAKAYLYEREGKMDQANKIYDIVNEQQTEVADINYNDYIVIETDDNSFDNEY